MELDASHHDMGLVDGLNEVNIDSAKSGQPKRRLWKYPEGQRQKKQKMEIYPNVTFSDVGGNDSILEDLKQRCHYFLEKPELWQKMKGELVKSFLVHGPSGCGKTLLAHSIAGEYKLPMLSLTAAELVGKIPEDIEANIQDIFDQAAELAPCILFIDEIESITIKKDKATKIVENRFFYQLIHCINDLTSKSLPVLVVCATNRMDTMDNVFRTQHWVIKYTLRFPNKDARKSIIKTLCQKVQLADDVSLLDIADLTLCYAGYHLKKLVSFAITCALHRVISGHELQRENHIMDSDSTDEDTSRQNGLLFPKEMDRLTLTKSDFQKALTEVKPTATQSNVILVSNTTWGDTGGLGKIKKKLDMCLMNKIRSPELYQAFLQTSGLLLVGPSGCGKTTIAKALANQTDIYFLYVKGAELWSRVIGQSEENMHDLFNRASSLAPCILFIDEIDAICSRNHDPSVNYATAQLLMEMSFERNSKVYIIAATNSLDKLDQQLLHPFRFEIIHVDLPSPEGRVEILRVLTKNGTRPKLAADVDLDYIGKDRRCDGYSGADLECLVQEVMEAYSEQITEPTEASPTLEMPRVNKTHFETAFGRLQMPRSRNTMRRSKEIRKRKQLKQMTAISKSRCFKIKYLCEF